MPAPQPLEAVALVGATGTGKTTLSLAVAEHLSAEIVCCDSRQLYRRLDVATGKPQPSERLRVPHHLFDCLEVEERSSAGHYARLAVPCMADIRARGRLPLLVGGSGFYLEALRFGLPDIPEIPAEVTGAVEEEWRQGGPAALHAELRENDPAAAQSIGPSDRQRLVRAVAVHRATGRPFSSWRPLDPAANQAPKHHLLVFHLDLPRPTLYGRLDERTRSFFASGLLDEVRTLLADGVPPEAAGLTSLAYREAVSVVRGELDLASAVGTAQQETRRYAKRQQTWFRGRGARGGLLPVEGHGQSVGSAAAWIAERVAAEMAA